MNPEVKLLQLQKELELTKRKLRDASHERAAAIKSCNDEWDNKFSSQIDILLKRKEVDKQQEISAIQMEIDLQKEREILSIKAEYDAELKKIKETLRKIIYFYFKFNLESLNTHHSQSRV